MTTLLNDVILKTGLLEHIGTVEKPFEIDFFRQITYSHLFFSFIFPLICFILVAFMFKDRYEAKKRKDDIILNGFYTPDEDN